MPSRKYSSSSVRNQTDKVAVDGEGYLSWHDEPTKQIAMSQWDKVIQECDGHYRSEAVGGRFQDYSNLDTGVSGRPGLRWGDYDAFRPDEARPSKRNDIYVACDQGYFGEGLIRNIIDLMGDFTCQGIRLVHPNKHIETFYRHWWHRVDGQERTERMANYLFRLGNAVIRKQLAKVTYKVEQEIYRSEALVETEFLHKDVPKREIPAIYSFIHPGAVQVMGGALAAFVGKTQYGLVLPPNLRRLIKKPRNAIERQIVDELPEEIRKAAMTKSPVLLPSDRTSVLHYKKDDWQEWAIPILWAVMEDIATLKKLKLADRAALDGAISNIRVWKLGNIEKGIMPSPAAVAHLSDILENHTGVGTMDLVWTADIELLESKTTIHQFLGEEKYKPTLNNIYAGLGIPPTLTGTFGAAGTTNNFVSLKTLIQRLEYVRSTIRRFWESELVDVQKAMGFRFPAQVEFDYANLGDEEAMKRLLLDLADRNLISDELLQSKFNIEPELEKVRVNREQRDREAGRRVAKTSPYHDPQFGVALKKIALQTGVATPGQVGLRKENIRQDVKMYEKEAGEKTALEMRPAPGAGGKPAAKKKGISGQGRPSGKKDTTKRKTKTFKPKSKAVLEIWANAAQQAIADFLHEDILKLYGKRNMRQLSTEEAQAFEVMKFGVLCNLEPVGVVDENTILAALGAGGVPLDINHTYNVWVSEVTANLNRQLTVEELRQLQACLYATVMGDDNG